MGRGLIDLDPVPLLSFADLRPCVFGIGYRAHDLVQNSNNYCCNLIGTTNEYGAGTVHSRVNCRLFGDGEIPIHSGVCRHENIGDCRLEHQ